MNNSMWSTLPDEIIKNVCEYWSDYKESIYRRIMKVRNCETERAVVRWKNPKTAMIKMMTLKLPQVLESVNVSDITGKNKFIMPEIKHTKSMCVVKQYNPKLDGSFYTKTKQFNFVKGKDDEYNKFIAREIYCEWIDVKFAWERVLQKQYPAIYALVQEDIMKYQRFYHKEQHNYPSLTYHQIIELKHNFGTNLPKHITSL